MILAKTETKKNNTAQYFLKQNSEKYKSHLVVVSIKDHIH